MFSGDLEFKKQCELNELHHPGYQRLQQSLEQRFADKNHFNDASASYLSHMQNVPASLKHEADRVWGSH